MFSDVEVALRSKHITGQVPIAVYQDKLAQLNWENLSEEESDHSLHPALPSSALFLAVFVGPFLWMIGASLPRRQLIGFQPLCGLTL